MSLVLLNLEIGITRNALHIYTAYFIKKKTKTNTETKTKTYADMRENEIKYIKSYIYLNKSSY